MNRPRLGGFIQKAHVCMGSVGHPSSAPGAQRRRVGKKPQVDSADVRQRGPPDRFPPRNITLTSAPRRDRDHSASALAGLIQDEVIVAAFPHFPFACAWAVGLAL